MTYLFEQFCEDCVNKCQCGYPCDDVVNFYKSKQHGTIQKRT